MNDETSKLITKVERFARQEQLFAAVEPGRALHLCAAVSGGADSMALLRVLLKLREAFAYTLSACHVNHGLPGGRLSAAPPAGHTQPEQRFRPGPQSRPAGRG